jgi:hypothetical protein
MSYYPADVGRTMLKGGQRVTIEFPDLHYNRATVLKYLEEYGAAPASRLHPVTRRRYGTAIQEFKRAEATDASFLTPTCHSAELAAFCGSVVEAVAGKCKVSASRLMQMQGTIKSSIAAGQAHGQHRLLPLVSIAQLQQQGEQAGANCRLEVMVLRTMQCDSQASITAIVMDVDATVAALSLLTDPDLLRPGDMLSLPAPPPPRQVKWDVHDGAAADSFPLIRVDDVTCAFTPLPRFPSSSVIIALSAPYPNPNNYNFPMNVHPLPPFPAVPRSCIRNGKEALKVAARARLCAAFFARSCAACRRGR